jgi:predicted porin
MKNNVNLRKSVLAVGALLTIAGAAHAQSNVSMYGSLETGLRYATNQNAAGGNQVQMADGALNPSLFGFTGKEDLGNGMAASFTLEGGLQVKNGSSVNGAFGTLNNDSASTSRLFGRLAYVGLSGDFGSVNLGRQYTTAFLSTCVGDPLCGGGLIVSPLFLLYTSLRQDNMIAYQKSAGDFTFNAHYTVGEQAGQTSANSGYGLALTYAAGPLALSGGYQENNLPLGPKTKVATANTSYKVGAAKLMLGYVRNQLSNGLTQKNDVVYGGVTYNATPAWTLTGAAYNDKQRNFADGKHALLVAIADYAFSKRTATYLEVDYNKYQDAMRPFGATGPGSQLGMTLGIRHKF